MAERRSRASLALGCALLLLATDAVVAAPGEQHGNQARDDAHVIWLARDEGSGRGRRGGDSRRGQDVSPEDRQRLEQRFRALPPAQQQRLREAEERYRGMPPEQRDELRRRWEGMSESERERYRQRIEQRRD